MEHCRNSSELINILGADNGSLTSFYSDDVEQRDVEKARGFCDVIKMLSACGKPIVGHNIVIDLAYILAQFIGPLPPTMEGYKRMIHHTFPMYVACTSCIKCNMF